MDSRSRIQGDRNDTRKRSKISRFDEMNGLEATAGVRKPSLEAENKYIVFLT
jgi:hypothetical protein